MALVRRTRQLDGGATGLGDVVGLSYTEIGDSLEITLATVKWRIYKAREEVATALAREGITASTATTTRRVAAVPAK